MELTSFLVFLILFFDIVATLPLRDKELTQNSTEKHATYLIKKETYFAIQYFEYISCKLKISVRFYTFKIYIGQSHKRQIMSNVGFKICRIKRPDSELLNMNILISI